VSGPAEASRPGGGAIRVAAFGDADRPWARRLLTVHMGSEVVAVHGELLRPLELPGFVARADGEPVGLLTYRVAEEGCEVLSLHGAREGIGAGTALLEAARREAEVAGCRRLWLVTTNDNVAALRFYQRRGFRLAALRVGAVDESRRTLKPEIPEAGDHGIPIRDELELEIDLVSR
jgi:GNAT superfamily N-acetyltransferase